MRRIFNKRLILLVAMATLSITVTACSKDSAKENIEQNIDSSAKEIVDEKANELSPTDMSQVSPIEATPMSPTEATQIRPTDITVMEPVYEVNEEGIIKPEVAEATISGITEKVLTAISEEDYKTLADYVHPEKGVRFTPYTNVSLEKDVVFSQDDIRKFFENQSKYLWGNYDGSGFEISLTPRQYYEEFIYSAGFLYAEDIGYNEVISSGNMVENQFEVYENAIVVEYYFPGFDPNFGGADWQSLRLVYQLYANEWKLVGIIHNQYTI